MKRLSGWKGRRPRIAPDDPALTRGFEVEFSEEEYQWLEGEARALGLTVDELLRLRLEDALAVDVDDFEDEEEPLQ
jgi:hypothetical protein